MFTEQSVLRRTALVRLWLLAQEMTMNAKTRSQPQSALLPLLGAGVGLGLLLLNSGRHSSAQERRTGLELFDDVWLEVANRYYDVERLSGWNVWRHRFDERIHSIADAVYYANRMLDSLADRYTFLRTPRQVRVENSHANDQVAFPKLIADGVGYIDFTSFDVGSTGDQLRDAILDLADCNRIILNMRGNGGGLIEECLACCSLFLKEGLVVRSRQRLSNGLFEIRSVTLTQSGIVSRHARDGQSDRFNEVARYRPIASGKQLVALIDEKTASASEMMLGCLREHGLVTLIGRRTRGKGIGQDHINLRGGVRLSVTSMHYHLPGGHWLGDAGMTVSRGLCPDIELRHTDNRSCIEAAMSVFFPSR